MATNRFGLRHVLALALALFAIAVAWVPPPAPLSAVCAPTLRPVGYDIERVDGKPWSEVLAWLADRSGLPVATTCVPPGILRFQFTGRRGVRYTLREVLFFLRRDLLRHGWDLVPARGCLLLIAVEQDLFARLFVRRGHVGKVVE